MSPNFSATDTDAVVTLRWNLGRSGGAGCGGGGRGAGGGGRSTFLNKKKLESSDYHLLRTPDQFGHEV